MQARVILFASRYTYLDGRRVKTIQGRPTNLGPRSNKLPGLKFGLYGDNALGSIDVDNIVVKAW